MISLRKKIISSITVLILISILGLASCQTTDTDSPGTGGAPAALFARVYGKVDSLAPENTRNKVVLIMYHPNTKDSSGPNQMEWGRINKSGKYYIFYAAQPPAPVINPDAYFTISVADYHKTTSDKRAPHSILAGPKKLKPKKFLSHFHLHMPFDSVRVDFTVHDSTKRSVNDSNTQ